MARALAICSLVAPAAAVGGKNLNGLYSVASGAKQDVPFNTDYASKGHEYFDVYSPEIATHYGEVFWADMGTQSLPKEIVDRFAGKVIAITGYEHDQVMVEPVGQPGVNPDQDVSVPINWAYNHHYMMWMVGEHGELRKVAADPGMAHGARSMMMGMDKPSAKLRTDPSIPTNTMFSEGNGGESRHSFHGYPKGYAQLVDSPQSWHVTPMQIDTRNRDCGVTRESVNNCTKFVPGPEPKQSRFGMGIPKDTMYSGLLECPCTSRFGGDPLIYGNDTKTRIVTRKYEALGAGSCPASKMVSAAQSCFDGAQTLGIKATTWVNRTISDVNAPPACSVVPHENGTVFVNFNTATSTKPCTNATSRHGSVTSSINVKLDLKLEATPLSARFNRQQQGQICADGQQRRIRSFAVEKSSEKTLLEALYHCEAFCADHDECWGCTAHCDREDARSYGFLERACEFLAVTSCGDRESWAGGITGDISQYRTDSSEGVATITMSGPSTEWFGVGFNAQQMCDKPYAVIVNDTGVQEWKLGTCGDEGCHCASQPLASSIKLVSNTVQGSVRTVVMTRPLKGQTGDHYSFDLSSATLNVITAYGSSQAFAYHKAHAPTEIALEADGSSICVCDDGLVGKLCEADGVTGCTEFTKNCVPESATAAQSGVLLSQKNPTCDSLHYVGGLQACCHHKRILLDADQEIRPELLRYHMKIRFWFEEYKPGNPPSHYDLWRPYYQTEMWAGEYDIPPAFRGKDRPMIGYPDLPLGQPSPGTVSCTGSCPDGPDCECIHEINATWTMSNTRIIYAGGHCHAPACISMELYYYNQEGKPVLLCQQIPKSGRGNVTHDKFDEAGYILIPPCLWGSKDEGLEPPVWLPENTKLLAIKRNRNSPTMGHFGEMASWQMRAVSFKEPDYFI